MPHAPAVSPKEKALQVSSGNWVHPKRYESFEKETTFENEV
jgi:hypothetical protein